MSKYKTILTCDAKVGDKVKHHIFGEGEVIGVEGLTIEVTFKNGKSGIFPHDGLEKI